MNIIQLIIAAVFVNNIVLTNYVGINPTIASSSNGESAITMGLSITLMMTISTVITKLIHDYVLVPFNLQYLQVLVYVLVIVAVIYLCYALFKNSLKEKFESLDAFMPLIVINNLFLGVALIVTQDGLSLLETVFYSVGVGLGFMLVSLILSSINYKYRFVDMPRAFKEKPISIMALGLIALAFYGFSGLV